MFLEMRFDLGTLDSGERSLPFGLLVKDLLLQNRLAYQSQISYGASLGWGNKSLFAGSGSHDQDGRHAIYGKNPSKIFSRTKVPMTLWLGMLHGDSGLS